MENQKVPIPEVLEVWYGFYDMNLIGRVLNYYNFKEIKKGAHKTIYEKKI